jgi:hypothetical protein
MAFNEREIRMKRLLAGVVGYVCLSVAAFAGGAWVPPPGKGDIQLGFSRKTASSSWDASGEAFANTTNFEGHVVPAYHDFRYAYLSGEIGLVNRMSARFLVTYLYGLEGPHQDLEKNVGWSDAWLGLKYGVAQGSWPMTVGATMRTPALYDLPGAYSRYLFDGSGNRRGVSPEWRGVLKRDYTLSYAVSHSFREGGWLSAETGYTFREGAPANQIPLSGEIGWPLRWQGRWHGAAVKGSVSAVASLGNDSPARPDDRFRARADGTFNFNDASMLKAGVSLIVPLRGNVDAEIGYSQWLWGESARRYREPYVSLGYRF